MSLGDGQHTHTHSRDRDGTRHTAGSFSCSWQGFTHQDTLQDSRQALAKFSGKHSGSRLPVFLSVFLSSFDNKTSGRLVLLYCKENHVVPSRGWQRALQGRWWTCRLALACCGGSSSYFLLVGNLTGLVALLHSRIALSTKPLVLRNLLRVTSRRHQVGFQNPDTPPSSH